MKDYSIRLHLTLINLGITNMGNLLQHRPAYILEMLAELSDLANAK